MSHENKYCSNEELIKYRFEEIEKDVEELKTGVKGLDRITTLLEMQVQQGEKRDKQDEKRDEQLKDQHETLIKINENLKTLGESYKNLDGRVGKLETSKVDWNEVFRSTPGKVVPSVVGGLILALIIWYFGLK